MYVLMRLFTVTSFKLLCFIVILSSTYTKAAIIKKQNPTHDTTFQWSYYELTKPIFADTSFRIRHTNNLQVSINNDRSFYLVCFDTSEFSFELINKRTNVSTTIIKGRGRHSIDISNDFFKKSIRDITNKPFAAFKTIDPKKWIISRKLSTINNNIFKNKTTAIVCWEWGCTACMQQNALLRKQDFSTNNLPSNFQILGFHRGAVAYKNDTYYFSNINTNTKLVKELCNFSQFPMTDVMAEHIGVFIYPTTYIVDGKGIVRLVLMGAMDEKLLSTLLPSIQYYNLYL